MYNAGQNFDGCAGRDKKGMIRYAKDLKECLISKGWRTSSTKHLYFRPGHPVFIKSEYSYIIFDNCTIEDKELICSIHKKDLETGRTTYDIKGGYNEIIGYYTFSSIFDIKLVYNKTIIKEDIYVKITKLISNVAEYPGSAVYETNVSSIPEIRTDSFSELKFMSDSYEYRWDCFFKKK